MEENKFVVIEDGEKYDAYVISNFSFFDDKYCVYAVDRGNKDKDVYCDKVINNTLVKIENAKELEFVSSIVNTLVKSIGNKEDK